MTTTATSKLYIVTISDDLDQDAINELWDELCSGHRSHTSLAATPWDESDSRRIVIEADGDGSQFEAWADEEDGIESYEETTGKYIPADEYDGEHDSRETWDAKMYVLVTGIDASSTYTIEIEDGAKESGLDEASALSYLNDLRSDAAAYNKTVRITREADGERMVLRYGELVRAADYEPSSDSSRS